MWQLGFAVLEIVILAAAIHLSLMGRIRIRYCIYAIVGVIAVAGLMIAVGDAGTAPHYTEALPFLGAMLVAAGWVMTNEVNLRNSRKQHTISLISDFMIRKERLDDRTTIRKYLPKHSTSVAEVTDFAYEEEGHELARAIDRELNFYEFIAIGLKSGDLDPVIAFDSIRGLLTSFVGQTRPYIDFWRSQDAEIWENAVALAEEWRYAIPYSRFQKAAIILAR